MTAETNRGGKRRAGLLTVVTVAAVVVALVPAAGSAASGPAPVPRADAAAGSTAAEPGPFVSLLFSRTEISAADNCVEDDDSIARLDTTVAPYLQSLGMAGTGTLVTARTSATTRHCTHYNDDLTASWADATGLAQNYGWSFVSHTATYPSLQKIQNLTPAQAQAETCGSLTTLKTHGLPGAAGMIAYPGSYTKNPAVVNLQTQYGQTCFDWGQQYHHAFNGITGISAASTPTVLAIHRRGRRRPVQRPDPGVLHRARAKRPLHPALDDHPAHPGAAAGPVAVPAGLPAGHRDEPEIHHRQTCAGTAPPPTRPSTGPTSPSATAGRTTSRSSRPSPPPPASPSLTRSPSAKPGAAPTANRRNPADPGTAPDTWPIITRSRCHRRRSAGTWPGWLWSPRPAKRASRPACGSPLSYRISAGKRTSPLVAGRPVRRSCCSPQGGPGCR